MSAIQQALLGRGGRASLSVVFSANATDQTVTVSGLSGYVAGKSDVKITINSGVYVYATATSNAGLTTTGIAAGDTVKIVNSGGFILGKGADGAAAGVNGTNGGPALSLGSDTTIDNTNASAYIAGGGGSGAGTNNGKSGGSVGGGGAGGGAGGGSSGGAGGGPGSAGSNGSGSNQGGGGGRILPGTGGAGGDFAAGVGGGSGGGASGSATNGAGGTGNAAGTTGTGSGSGGGGGWGATGGNGALGQTGGSGGNGVSKNGHTATFVSGDTTRVYGAIA